MYAFLLCNTLVEACGDSPGRVVSNRRNFSKYLFPDSVPNAVLPKVGGLKEKAPAYDTGCRCPGPGVLLLKEGMWKPETFVNHHALCKHAAGNSGY